MGRMAVLLGFSVVGYILGITAWFMKTPVLQAVESLGLSTQLSQSLLAGLFGSAVMVVTVLCWSFLSSK
jgi:hypothetical protein